MLDRLLDLQVFFPQALLDRGAGGEAGGFGRRVRQNLPLRAWLADSRPRGAHDLAEREEQERTADDRRWDVRSRLKS